jgi:hypothetical protein
MSLSADKGYDVVELIEALMELKVLPHVAQNTRNRESAVPDCVAKSEGYNSLIKSESSSSRDSFGASSDCQIG